MTPNLTQRGIGAAHGPREKIGGSTEVSSDPMTNSRRYRAAHKSHEQFNGSTGVSHDPSNDSWRYWGVPLNRETT